MIIRSINTACKAQSCRRCFSTASALFKEGLSQSDRFQPDLDGPEIKDLAILGGGITGLASAYFATLAYPSAKITIFESSEQPGGWLRSSEHDVNGGKVIFEQGPRSLRPTKGTLALIIQLGLEQKLLITSKSSDAAKNRYLYSQDRLMLVGSPDKPLVILSNPVLRSAVREIFGTFMQLRTVDYKKDETIGEFFRRRGCPGLANNMVSAMMHGIYAGDIDELSASSILPAMMLFESRYGSPYEYLKQSLLARFTSRPRFVLYNWQQGFINDFYAHDVLKEVSRKDEYLSSSIYTLKGGLETLATTLVEKLRDHPQVEMVTEAYVERIGPVSNTSDNSHNNKKACLTVLKQQKGGNRYSSPEFDRIISTIPSTSLAKICSPLKDSLGQGTTSTVCVVNLFYGKPDLLSTRGFGYLIPKSTPRAKNPEGALGVVFDTDATPELDSAPGTKLTVMLGGPFWKDVTDAQLPSNSEAIEMAKNVVSAHLGIKTQPVLARANLHKNCIPQYTVGHTQRMLDAATTMSQGKEPWMQCVRVAGSSYGGVGVNDCITNAYWTVSNLRGGNTFGNESAINPYVWMEGGA